MEWLSARINKSMLERKFGGLKICRDAPNISHLFFADDSLIFLKARASEAGELLNILSEYEKLSGQKVNFLKSEICFSKNANDDVRKAVKDLLNIKEVDYHSKYLGLPLVAGQKLSAVCGELVEKLWSKLQSWENLKLSVGGREILIKAILQAIPQYTMSCVYLPESIINKLSSAIVNFWWSGGGGKNFICHGGHLWEVRKAAWKIKILFDQFSRAHSVYTIKIQQDSFKWVYPAQGVVKFNADGSWKDHEKRAGIGCVARNNSGIVLLISAYCTNNLRCSSEAEGLALLRCMEEAKKLKLKRVLFETDSAEVFIVLELGRMELNWNENWINNFYNSGREKRTGAFDI
ncbi:hypothetical protein QQ045_028246 [Rhodiola kirilowii]